MLAVLHLTYLGSIFDSSTDDTNSDEVQLTFFWNRMAPAFCVSYYLYLLHDLNDFLLSAGWHGQSHHWEMDTAQLDKSLVDLWPLGPVSS